MQGRRPPSCWRGPPRWAAAATQTWTRCAAGPLPQVCVTQQFVFRFEALHCFPVSSRLCWACSQLCTFATCTVSAAGCAHPPTQQPHSPADGNAQALFDFLTSSSEVPEATRRWPAWRQRLVPKIVLALSGRQVGGGSGPAAAAELQPARIAAAACPTSTSKELEDWQKMAAAEWAPGSSGAAAADATAGQQDAEGAPPHPQRQHGQQQPGDEGTGQRQQQRQQQRARQEGAQPQDSVAADQARSTAYMSSHSGAKENRRPSTKPDTASSTATAHAVASSQRSSSVRQRRANSQLSGYFVDYE